MTRIVAGTAGGRVLEVPVRGTRPTSDRVREAVFSRLEHQGAVDGARVLDLYAGSGALAIEAMSRGASDATLVDAARAAVEVCRRNVRALGLTRVRVAQQPAERFVREVPSLPWDLVFLDPPYDVTAPELVQVLDHLTEPGALAPDATVVVERRARDAEPAWPVGLSLVARKDYGETAVFYLEPSGADGAAGADASASASVPTGS
ncbi:16S rRNA (guanine(966)-N(2))-methyltransferase RsmD [Luteimicrobium sp. NPDC057192]|uniref:16S rRNA (guanine(966)-N(2))-methyltransferase RsmD n=1 Tax=Luteimicrobium sp. NPDC057192 TaxID=3346042 RepID=UPI0036255C21